jgi:GT2 family glycosyltransferase
MDSFLSTTLPATSLTICSRNRPKLLFDTIQSVLQGEEIPTELLIVDQSDAPNQFLSTLRNDRNCQIRYLWSRTIGVARARNAAIGAAQHEIIILLDDDELVTDSWFGTIVRSLVNAGQYSVVTGKVVAVPAEVTGGFAPSTKGDEVTAIYKGRIGEDVLFTGNMAMYRSAFKDLGMFDERLGAGGRFSAAYDNDFGFRLLEAGYRIIYVPKAAVHHRAWRSKSNYFRLRWNYGRGQGAFFAKYISLRDGYMMWRMLKSIKDHLLGFVWNIRHQRRVAYGNVVYVLGLLSGAAQWLLVERVIELNNKVWPPEPSSR